MATCLSDRECALATELRRVFQAVGYQEAAVKTALDVKGELMMSSGHVSRYRRSLRGQGPLLDIIRLFILAEPLKLLDAVRALAPVEMTSLEELGLVASKGEYVYPLVHLMPFRHVLLVHDLETTEFQPDHVSGPSPSSLVLEALTVRKPAALTLDVGSGCGLHALLAAAHSSRVVATDVNPRAVRFTELSAVLSGVDNVEARQGNRFEPAQGSTFDLILANLPYVLSPDQRYLFRDSGEQGDNMSEANVVSAAALLREGGMAVVMINWINAEGDWTVRPLRWLHGAGCDVWLLRARSYDPLTYAAAFLRPLEVGHPAYEAALDRWLDYYRRAEIGEIGAGTVILRRRQGRNWSRTDEMPFRTISASDHILRVFTAQDDLAALQNGTGLLDAPLRLVDRHRLEQTLYFQNGQYSTPPARLMLEQGVGVAASVPASHLGLLFHFDGSRPLKQVLSDVSGLTAGEADAVSPGLMSTVRHLYELGMLQRS